MRNKQRRQRHCDSEGSIRRVRLVAPSDLPGGYEFPVLLQDNGGVYMVKVPVQGVQHGQTFVTEASVIRQEDHSAIDPTNDDDDGDDGEHKRLHVVTQEMAVEADPHHIPYGKFRDGLCVCAKHGCCNPSCCLSCVCVPCALGQILWRLRLDHWARPLSTNYDSPWTTFQILTLVCFYYSIAIMFFNTLVNNYQASATGENENDDDVDTSKRNIWVVVINGISIFTTLVFTIYIILVLFRTRRWIRHRYNIPAACGACSDCCCVCCCTFCVVCQLGRHTANYEEYPAHCCTDTGLGRGAPEIV